MEKRRLFFRSEKESIHFVFHLLHILFHEMYKTMKQVISLSSLLFS